MARGWAVAPFLQKKQTKRREEKNCRVQTKNNLKMFAFCCWFFWVDCLVGFFLLMGFWLVCFVGFIFDGFPWIRLVLAHFCLFIYQMRIGAQMHCWILSLTSGIVGPESCRYAACSLNEEKPQVWVELLQVMAHFRAFVSWVQLMVQMVSTSIPVMCGFGLDGICKSAWNMYMWQYFLNSYTVTFPNRFAKQVSPVNNSISNLAASMDIQ